MARTPQRGPVRRIALVNRYAPPSEAPTGVEAMRLAGALAQALPGTSIRLYAMARAYGRDAAEIWCDLPGETNRQAPPRASAPSDSPVAVVRLGRVRSKRATSNPKHGRRLVDSLVDALRLCLAAFRWADVVITLTDPPFLSPVAGALSRFVFPRTRWVEWCLDRFPELFVATGLIADRHPLYRALLAWDRRQTPDFCLATGPGMIAHVHSMRTRPAAVAVLPPGLHLPAEAARAGADSNARRSDDGPVTLAYAGNLGHVAPAQALAALMARADPARIRFRIAAHGVHAATLYRAMQPLPHITWSEHLSDQELRAADLHVATLRPAASHLCLPAKAISALSLGRPLLWLGSPGADAWQAAQGAGWVVPVGPEGSVCCAQLDQVLAQILDAQLLAAKSARAVGAGNALRRLHAQSLQRLVAHLQGGRS